MADSNDGPASPETEQALRRRAEVRVLEKQDQFPENARALTPDQSRKLLHELRVHQIELELQNEELRSAQEQLRTAETRYLDLYEKAPVGYLTLDKNGIILTANSTAEKLFAAERQPLVGLPLNKFILPEDQDTFYLHGRRLEKGEAGGCELRMLGAVPFWARLASTIGQQNGGEALWRVMVSDVSEAKAAQALAALAAQNWQKTFDAIGDVVWMLDADCRVTLGNQATERVFGRPVSELLGMHCYEIVHGTDHPIEGCPLQRARKSMHREKLELESGERTFEIIVDPIADGDGRFNGAVHVLMDITGRKNIEREKQRLMDRLEEKKKEMDSFLYITTHDLRTPLVNILGFSQNLAKDTTELLDVVKPAALPEEKREVISEIGGERIPSALNYISQSAQKMEEVITAMLKISRAGSVEIHPETVEMNEALKVVMETMRYQFEEAGAVLKAGELPPCTADPVSVNHIFTNLLANAVKYRDKDRKLEITVSGKKNGTGTVLYSVADNGPGIKAADLPRIWQLFFRGEVPGVKKGEGIGLALVRRMVDRNAGRIWAESKEGEGSTFFVELPA